MTNTETIQMYAFGTLQEAFDYAVGACKPDEQKGDNGPVQVCVDWSGRSQIMLREDIILEGPCPVPPGQVKLNLCGHCIESTDFALQITGGSLTVEGQGGAIRVKGEKDAVCITLNSDARASLHLANVQLQVQAKHGNAIGIWCGKHCDITLKTCKITASGNEKTAGVLIHSAAQVTGSLTDCSVSAVSLSPFPDSLACGLVVNSPRSCFTIQGGQYTADFKRNAQGLASGMLMHGSSTLRNVCAKGVHSGVLNKGRMWISGGNFTSPGHGGIYNCHTLAAQDAVISNSPYQGLCGRSIYRDALKRLGAMYNGSTQVQAVAYLDNCRIENSTALYGLVVTQNYGHLSGSVYVSRCYLRHLRVDGTSPTGQTGTAYIGKNCAFLLKSKGETGLVDRETYRGTIFDHNWVKEHNLL